MEKELKLDDFLPESFLEAKEVKKKTEEKKQDPVIPPKVKKVPETKSEKDLDLDDFLPESFVAKPKTKSPKAETKSPPSSSASPRDISALLADIPLQYLTNEKEEVVFPDPDESNTLDRSPPNPIQTEFMYICQTGKVSVPDSRYKKYVKEDDALKKMPVEEGDNLERHQRKIQIDRKVLKDEYVFDCVKAFLDAGAKLNWADWEGNTPLHHLAILGVRKTVEYVIEKGAKINVKGRNGGTPLWWAISAREADVAFVLSERGATPNTKNDDGISALQLACDRVDPKSVGILVEKGAQYGESLILRAATAPFVLSANNNRLKAQLLATLVKDRPDIQFTAVNENGETALLYTARYFRPGFRALWKATEKNLKAVLPNKKTGETLIRILCQENDLYALDDKAIIEIQLVTKKGININERDENGKTLLHEAVHNVGLVTMLLDKQLDPNAQDKFGNTPLHYAVKALDAVNVVKYLLRGKADPTIKNNDGKTPIELLGSTKQDEEIKRAFNITKKADPLRATAETISTTPPQANKILQSGYLTKEGGSITTWKRRYFELTPTELRYYLEPKSPEKGVISLGDIIGNAFEVDDLKHIPLPIGKAKYIFMNSIKAPIIQNCFAMETRKRVYHMYADNREEMEAWISKLNQAISEFGHTKRYRLQTLRATEKTVDHPDFSGEWVPDTKLSEPLDNILKALGRNWVDRKISKTPNIKIIQNETQLTIDYGSLPGSEKVKSLSKKETYDLEGTEQVKEFDPFAGAGIYRTQTNWSDDGSQLITRTYLTSSTYNSKATLVTYRFLENETTMVHTVQLLLSAEFAPTFPVVKRVFKKKT